eukprot:6488567-Amphidinium_carterae.1
MSRVRHALHTPLFGHDQCVCISIFDEVGVFFRALDTLGLHVPSGISCARSSRLHRIVQFTWQQIVCVQDQISPQDLQTLRASAPSAKYLLLFAHVHNAQDFVFVHRVRQLVHQFFDHAEVSVFMVCESLPPWNQIWLERLGAESIQPVLYTIDGLTCTRYYASEHLVVNVPAIPEVSAGNLDAWEESWGFIPRHTMLCAPTSARKQSPSWLAAARLSHLSKSSSPTCLVSFLRAWAAKKNFTVPSSVDVPSESSLTTSLVHLLTRASDTR